jgi:3-hydroxyacyl-[acyl-carrier-protein] dehydratase
MPPKPNKLESFDIEQILKVLPHRYPFLLVDRVLSMEKGKSLTALKNVTYNEPFFAGHFPEHRVMPGVLVVEALAQAGGILLHFSTEDERKKLYFLSKVDNAKFRKPVIPGDQLILNVELIKAKRKFYSVHARALVNDELVTECDIMAYIGTLEELDE